MVYISEIETPVGIWKITASERGISGVYPSDSKIFVNENDITRQAAQELEEYFVHIRTEFSTPLDPSGTPFQQQVWEVLRRIPYGQIWSYSQVAAALGRPTAVRAAAQAIGRNPCLILIPCHRVLGKDGSLTGFSAGLPLKEFLLQLEGIRSSGGVGETLSIFNKRPEENQGRYGGRQG